MKKISIVVPTYNEEKNIRTIYERLCTLFQEQLRNYEMQLLFIDNASADYSRDLIEELCQKDNRVQAIFNATNFGFSRSSFYADMQDPPEVIPKFVKKWEEGYKIVTGIKSQSKENKLMYAFRGIYYNIIAMISEGEHIKQFDGFGLYDASFVKVLRQLKDPIPYLRGLVAELGCKRAEVEYTQEKRKAGKTSFNFARYYDVAMLGLTSSTKAIMRMATFLGIIMAGICGFILMLEQRQSLLEFSSWVVFRFFSLVFWENIF